MSTLSEYPKPEPPKEDGKDIYTTLPELKFLQPTCKEDLSASRSCSDVSPSFTQMSNRPLFGDGVINIHNISETTRLKQRVVITSYKKDKC